MHIKCWSTKMCKTIHNSMKESEKSCQHYSTIVQMFLTSQWRRASHCECSQLASSYLCLSDSISIHSHILQEKTPLNHSLVQKKKSVWRFQTQGLMRQEASLRDVSPGRGLSISGRLKISWNAPFFVLCERALSSSRVTPAGMVAKLLRDTTGWI